MYADDNTVIYSADDIETLCGDLKEELANISEQMRSNKLNLNASKSEFPVVRHKGNLTVSKNLYN